MVAGRPGGLRSGGSIQTLPPDARYPGRVDRGLLRSVQGEQLRRCSSWPELRHPFCAYRQVGLDGTTYHAGGANGGNAAVSSDYGSAAAAAAGRELLQNIVETRKPNSATGGGGGVSQGLSLSGGRLAVESPTTEEALLLLDRSPQQEEKEVMRQVYLQLHNLPQAYLTDERLRRKIPVPKNKTASASKTCGVYPRLYELSISNLYWQVSAASQWATTRTGATSSRARSSSYA